MQSSDAAKASLRKALDLDPKMAGTWQTMGYMASDQGDWSNAVRDLGEAERLDPLSTLPWFVSAIAYYRLHRFAEAEASIRAEMKLDPQLQYPRSQFVLGLILIARHDVEGGTASLRNYLASSPDPRDVATASALVNQPMNIASK
jgi:Flp pilus assembly protein TadD